MSEMRNHSRYERSYAVSVHVRAAAVDNEEIVSTLSFFVSLRLFSLPSLALLALFLPFFRAFHITVLLFRIAYFLPRFSQLVFAQKQKEKEGNNKKKNTSFLGC